ncbi:hypothetical protein C7446_0875 [Kushneria sinocarnis]|uniref:DUF2959 family protein n=1 Tax=Kushneria sinocarnis TaxID=595502 RepID=A0A420WZT9_9GAMM|nr:DUF2959 family protein [Kushneria sinocarnis]RKR06876.1 hypothetical protein C7446_0875 [Kushneria sinocarnis]
MRPAYLQGLCCAVLLLSMNGCQSAYYSAMEQAGVPIRTLVVNRVEAARDAQQEAGDQFSSALERFRSVVQVPESELSRTYDALADEYEASQRAAQAVHQRIDAIEGASEALFDEWQGELDDYHNASYRQRSAAELKQARQHYAEMLDAMHEAEQSLQPALDLMHDNVLFLKHNLNARAIGALAPEVDRLEARVTRLRQQMHAAIERSNRFIATLPD